MGLQPLEFSDCLTDSPFFREKLHAHEKELERTSKAIKGLIAECKELINATKSLSKAQKSFSQNLLKFKFECIGNDQTEDEIAIENSLEEFGKLIAHIEEEREKILSPAFKTVIEQLEEFRKEKIGHAKEEKKKFEKSTAKFCQALEKHLSVKSKSGGDVLKEADAQVDLEKRAFYESSMQYVLVLQDVQERKKFEFVESLLLFMLSWLNFYHQGYEQHKEYNPYIESLKITLQKCRENFDVTNKEAEQLKRKMLEVRGTKPLEQRTQSSNNWTREGYLYLLEKKPLGTTWSKIYCQYAKETKILSLIPYSQQAGKGVSGITTETSTMQSCRRRATDTIERRFCFDVTVQEKQAEKLMTLQALSEDDMQLWLQAMDGKEPIYSQPALRQEYDSFLDDIGFKFIKRCIDVVETRGLDEQGLYRIVGVASKVAKLTSVGLDKRKCEKLDLSDPDVWETKTITSAIKNYFRSLPEPIMTFELHPRFIAAAKRESKTLRLCDVHELVHKLPEQNFEMLKILVAHLKRVSQSANKNLMTVPNLGVCFGPTLLRPPEETMAAIMDIKWCNIVVELLIYNFEKFFNSAPEGADVSNSRVLSSSVHGNDQQSVIQAGLPSNLNVNNIPFIENQLPTSVLPLRHMRANSTGAPVTAAPRTSVHHNNHHITNNQVAANHQHHIASSMLADGSRERTGSFGTSSNNSVMSSSYTTGMPPAFNYPNNNGPAGDMGQPQPAQTYAQIRQKIKPNTGIHSQYSPDHNSSRSSSSESLTSRSSSAATQHSSPVLNSANSTAGGAADSSSGGGGGGGVVVERSGGVIERNSGSSDGRASKAMSSVQQGINRFSQMPTSGLRSEAGRKVRALYACDAENDSELSFEPNDVISNVRMSKEPGWLEGILNGKSGLIPANYVVYVD